MSFQLAGRCGRIGLAARTSRAAIIWRRLNGGESPFVPFGQLRGVLLCQHQLRDGSSPLVLRELLPTLDLRRGRCLWSSGPVVCDLSRPLFDLGDPQSIKPWQKSLIEVAAVLQELLAKEHYLKDEPCLPYTLATFPGSAHIVPRPTGAIVQIAERQNIDWPTAWQRLAAERAVSPSDNWIIRFDTRLCDRIRPGLTWPGAIALEHDLRNVPMCHVWQPPLHASVPESLFIYQPHAILDGWNGPPALMQRLGMERFLPAVIENVPALAG